MADALNKAQFSPEATASAIPVVQVPTTPAPLPGIGKTPNSRANVSGMRTNYSRVNTGAPMPTDAGASSQKSLEPKMAGAFFKSQSEVPMTQAAARPTLQQMLKHAMAGAASSMDDRRIADAARAQLEVSGNWKEASAPPEGPPISREYAHKLASAIDYYVETTFGKVAEDSDVSPGHGPGALDVTQAMDGPAINEDTGQAHQQPPMNPSIGKSAPNAADAATALDNDSDHRPGADAEASWAPMGDKTKISQVDRIRKVAGIGKQARSGLPSMTSAAEMVRKATGSAGNQASKRLAAMTGKGVKLSHVSLIRKLAEDAINPAQISGGKAVPPDTLDATDPGPPGEYKSLLPTTPEGVADFTRRQAKSPMKGEMPAYVDEPMQSASTDKALHNAFAHTDEAGAKVSSARATSAARALFNRLAEEA